jgi:hypothetical protein
MQPFKFLLFGLKWFFTELMIELSRIKVWVESAPADVENFDYDGKDDDYVDETAKEIQENAKKPPSKKMAEAHETEEYFRAVEERLMKRKTEIYYPCDKQVDLYVLNKDFIKKGIGKNQDNNTNVQ